MPDGIIRDPKMNPTERQYGILYSATFGGYLAYDKIKKSDPKRFWIAGLRVHYNYIEDLPATINYDEYSVTKKVDDGVVLLSDENAHKVYKKILGKIEKHPEIFNGVDSEVPD